jgi:flagellin-like protein
MKRTGVSPVIATLLLIVIAVAAAVLAYIWIIGYQGTLTQQATATQLQERIKIEAVGYYPGNKLNASVRNIGDVTVNVTAIYVYNVTTGTVAAYKILTGTDAVVLAPGQVSAVPKVGNEVTVTLKPGVTYTVKVVTQKGTEATYTFTYRT